MTDHRSPPSDMPRPRRRRGMRILLFVSLALNLAVIGMIGGAIHRFSSGDGEPPHMVSRELGLAPFRFAFDSGERKQLDAMIRSRNDELGIGRQEWRRSYIDALAAIRAEPFDAGGFRAAMERQAELSVSSRRAGLEIMISQFEAMTSDERQAFADRFARRAQKLKIRGERPGGGQKGNNANGSDG
ncbi:periplasmic heavy metal sensor [Tropicimonas sp.]|uniref:periplasmic heavy metal sensor n=1 Tax=Tropicimonas sp. TaxID=2067044 RepID=UPI003A887463